MISCKNISATKDDTPVLEDISFEVKPGDCLLIKGKNGSGKTTLLKTIAGLEKPTSGQISFNGTDITYDPSFLSGALLYIGHKNALSNLTVRKNLEFWAELYGSSETVEAAATYFGLEEYLDTPVKNLSAGQKRKAALCRLLCCQSAIWVLDEPTSNLDDHAIYLLEGAINTKLQNGGVAIIATHSDLNIANKRTLELE